MSFGCAARVVYNLAALMDAFWKRLYAAARRVVPNCVAQSQGVAFNMFLAAMPMLLIVMGVASLSARTGEGFQEMLSRLSAFMPPGVRAIVLRFVLTHSTYPWRWISLGMGGTLLAGMQMMRLVIDGFQMLRGNCAPHGGWSKQFRALLLLLVTIAPWLVAANLLVFGKQSRQWLIQNSASPLLVRFLWVALYIFAALFLAMLALAVIYRVGRPSGDRGGPVLPGAALATLLWWIVSGAFGFYMRHVPYSLVYGGLAVAIGLMLWMQLTATILFLGAAFNIEVAASRSAAA
ncbi:MAG: YihY/virulence factor BrkB family protein [Candidatus Acidiferrales bacterium]